MFRTRPDGAFFLIVLSGFLFTFFDVPSQTILTAENTNENSVLILQRGPYREAGLPFFSRDLTPYFRAEYSLGEDRFEVYYLEDDMKELQLWDSADCRVGADVLNADGRSYYYRAFGKGGCLIYQAEPGFDICSLIPAFERRFTYFLGTTPEWLLPPFPAIVEL